MFLSTQAVFCVSVLPFPSLRIKNVQQSCRDRGTRNLCVLAASLMRLITCSGPSENCSMAQTNDQNPEKACLSSVANLLGCFRENTYLLHADLITKIYCLLCSLQGCVNKYPQHSPGETITDTQGEIHIFLIIPTNQVCSLGLHLLYLQPTFIYSSPLRFPIFLKVLFKTLFLTLCS